MISKKCPNCEYENPENAKFCNECGSKLEAGEAVLPPRQASSEAKPPEAPAESPGSEPSDAPAEPFARQADPSPEPAPEEPAAIPEPGPPESPEPPVTASPPSELETPSEPAPSSSDISPASPAPGENQAGPYLLTTASALVPISNSAIEPELPSKPLEKPAEPAPSPDGSPPEESAIDEPSPHHPFGERFQVMDELGKGNLGVVYKVFDKAMERELALKSIKPDIAENKDVFEGFSREMKAERGIVHKNIARIFELSVMTGTPFITMEYVSGQDLLSVIKEKRRLPVMEAFTIAKHIFNGLAEAHRHGAFHLDLRPDNIRIDKEGTTKIMDLGISRMFRSKGITRVAAGMPQYMSPEQLEGQEADARSDIYAAGAIFYEMLTGSLVPVGQTPRSPKELNPGIPSELSLLVLKCLEKDKEARYQTAKSVWEELDQMETGINQVPVEPPTPPPVEKPAVPVREAEAPPAAPVSAEVLARPERVKTRKRTRSGFSFPRKAVFPALAVLAVVILGIFLWKVIFKSSKAPAPAAGPLKTSLAVLPFEDLDQAQDNQYLGDALAMTLARELRKAGGFLLPDKESTYAFKGPNRDSRIIGRRLRVDHYLDGSLQAEANTLRVGVKLVRTDTGAVVWSGQYEREQESILAVIDEIERSVVQAIGSTRTLAPAPSSNTVPTVGFEAYKAYARGCFLANNGDNANLEKALGQLEKATAEGPNFALAFEALADTYIRLADGRSWAPGKAFPKAKDAALKALLIDPRLAEAHVSLADVKTFYEWDFSGAEEGYRKALQIDPDCSPAHQSYALLLSALGRHSEAIAEIRIAQTLNPMSSPVNARAGLVLYFARLYEQANNEIKKAVATDALYHAHYYNLALLQIQMGRFEEAIPTLRRAAELGADPMEIKLLLAHVYARQDQRPEVGRILTEAFKADKTTFVSQVSVASVYAGLNEKDQVMACLEIADNQRESGLLFLKVHPMFDFIRADPRFVRLMQKIGLGS
jgi:TolB-like protein/Tfp pilus assembly protein PilF